MPLTSSLSPALTIAQSFSPINSWVSGESITLASWPCFVDQRYPQTPHSHTTPTHVSLSHILLKLYISVNDFPKKRSLFLLIFWSQAAKCLNIYWAPLCFQAHVSHQERHGGSHGPCTDHNLMSNDITTSKEAFLRRCRSCHVKLDPYCMSDSAAAILGLLSSMFPWVEHLGYVPGMVPGSGGRGFLGSRL